MKRRAWFDNLMRDWPWTFVWFVSIVWVTFVVVVVTKGP